MLKRLVMAGFLVFAAGSARADWCHWLSSAEAQKAAGMLKVGGPIKQYCAECNYPMPRLGGIRSVVVKKGNIGDSVEVNGVHISLATTYILNGGQMTNLAMLLGVCGVTEKQAPRILPDGEGV